MEENAIVSKCLLGAQCRWDGKSLDDIDLDRLSGYVPSGICPEMAGGLPSPRPAAWIEKGDGFSVLDGKSRVLDIDGRDVTDNFLKGAQAALNIALKKGIKVAFLKNNSPSCGVTKIVRNDQKIPGLGVTSALLKRHGIKLESI